ncbi:MAG: hypothetical protein RL701_1316, partial [Pseudomonadota bacterium]
MKDASKHSLWIASAGMEITWLCAWSAFTLDAITRRPYPVEQITAGFIVAALIAWLCTGRGLRIVEIVLAHALGFTGFVTWGLWSLWFRHEPLWSTHWLQALFSQARPASDYVTLLLFSMWTGVTWLSGVHYAQRPRTYAAVCQRFDAGLTWLFALLLGKLLLTTGAGLQFNEHVSEALVLPFFCFGILALAVARNTSGQHKRFMSGYRGIGLMGAFAALVALLGTGAVLLFTPYLQQWSEAGYSELIHSDSTFFRIL